MAPRRTHTHTVAILQVSPSAYAEIRGTLNAALYQHTFMDDGVIDMSGIGVQPDHQSLELLSWNGCLTGDCPHDDAAACDKAIADDVRLMLKGFQPDQRRGDPRRLIATDDALPPDGCYFTETPDT